MIIVILTDPMILTATIFIVGWIVRMVGNARSSINIKTIGEFMIILGGCGFVAASVANHNVIYNFGNENICYTVGDLSCKQ